MLLPTTTILRSRDDFTYMCGIFVLTKIANDCSNYYTYTNIQFHIESCQYAGRYIEIRVGGSLSSLFF